MSKFSMPKEHKRQPDMCLEAYNMDRSRFGQVTCLSCWSTSSPNQQLHLESKFVVEAKRR